MPIGIGAAGYIGVALETTAGTYVAPAKFFPIRSESFKYQQETHWRRVIRGLADNIGGIAGHAHVEGDIEMELLADVLPYFLRCSRNTVVKSGTGPYTYTFTPSSAAQAPDKTMSITIVRNGAVFGYVGCVVGSMEFSQDSSVATFKATVVGNDEASQSLPTPTFANQLPFGAGTYNIQVPTATQVLDTDTFSFQIEDNAEAQNRLSLVRGAQYIKFGERTVTVNMERDFITRTEYDLFKTVAAAGVTILITQGANNQVTLKAAAAIRDTYDVNGLASQGDIIKASVSWIGTYDASSSKAYEIIVITTENIT